MLKRLTLPHFVVAAIILLAGLFAVGWATRVDPAGKPLLTVLGGGFVFNYRLADIYYGFTAVIERPLESGSVIEASFENPSGGLPLVVRERVSPMTNRYDFRSPRVRGVKAEQPYKVAIRVLDRLETSLVWATEITFRSQVSDENMPDKPLTVGPGYTKNPQADQ